MAGNSTISITFKLDGDGKGFKGLANDADGLKRVISATVSEAKQLNAEAVNFAAIATGLQTISQSVEQLRAGLQNLADAYAVQEMAETRLSVVMQQRMSATAAEIQSIKDLASAQQALGVIGDEVQLSGAQQVATFLSEVESLRILMPAMNNLLAQQKGLNATTQDAVNIGNLMGKVMQGQTAALTRVGITFTAAEEKVLKYGTESERAATLAQVITNNVGEMNAALAQTESGKQQQLVNTLGDMKEQIGDIVNGALPFVTIASSALSATVNVGLLVMGVQKLLPYISAINIQGKAAAAATLLMGVNAKRSTVVMRVFSTALRTGAHSATALKLALRGLLIATGVGVAIAAVTTAVECFSSAADKAADKERELADEMLNFKRELRDLGQIAGESVQTEISELDKLYKIAKDESKSRKERSNALQQLQSKYPAYFSALRSEAINVKTLTAQYDSLRDAILDAARARAASKKIEENTGRAIDLEMSKRAKEKEVEDLTKRVATMQKAYTAALNQEADEKKQIGQFTEGMLSNGGMSPVHTKGGLKAQELAPQLTTVKNALATAKTELDQINTKIGEVNTANQELAKIIEDTPGIKLASNVVGVDPDDSDNAVWKADAQSLEEITGNIKILNGQLQKARNVEEAAGINQQIAAWNAKADAIRNAGKAATDNKPLWKEDAATLEDINGNIQILQGELQKATAEEAVLINRQIEAWNKKAEAIRNAGKSVDDTVLLWKEDAATLKEITENIRILQNKLENATVSEAALINQQIDAWNAKADAIRNAGKEADKTGKSIGDNLVQGWGAIKGMTGSVESLIDSIKGSGSAWQIVVSSLDMVVGLYQGVMSIVEIVQAFTAASAAHAAVKGVEATTEASAATTRAASAATTAASSAAVITANKLEAASFRELAASEYMAAHAAIPFAGFAIGAGFTASMLATVSAAGIPKLANGGIASGPTLALVGEYAGASGNPEVIAPLDKLRRMIEPAGFGGGEVEFKIAGRTLLGLLSKETKHRNRG